MYEYIEIIFIVYLKKKLYIQDTVYEYNMTQSSYRKTLRVNSTSQLGTFPNTSESSDLHIDPR